MMKSILNGCPHCDRSALQLNEPILLGRLLQGGRSLVDDLAHRASETILDFVDGGEGKFPVCDHSVLFQMVASLDRGQRNVLNASQTPGFERYIAAWYHPCFGSVTNRWLAGEMKIRLADGMPHGAMVQGSESSLTVLKADRRIEATESPLACDHPAMRLSMVWLFHPDPEEFLRDYRKLIESFHDRPLHGRPVGRGAGRVGRRV